MGTVSIFTAKIKLKWYISACLGVMVVQVSCSVTGLEGLDTDLTVILGQFQAASNRSLDKISSAMLNTLSLHIEKDVYAASVYYPTVYKRRSENFSLGTALNNVSVNAKPLIENMRAGIDYQPTGEHAVKKWGGVEGRWGRADGDQLIARIEKKSPPYTWGQDKVPERPFWRNFVTEMIEGGVAERTFIKAMGLQGTDWMLEADGQGVIREEEDGSY